MRQIFFLLTSFLLLTVVKAQPAATAQNKVPATWKKFHLAPRVGVGIQKSFYTEAGISLQKYIYEMRHGFMVLNIYSVYEWIPASSGEKAVYGVKAGYEIVNNTKVK